LIYIKDLQRLCYDENIAITKHANIRLHDRRISIDDIKHAIKTGVVIRQYEDDKPFPSCLLLGSAQNGQYIHVVTSINEETLYIITAYVPSETEWENGFKTRKGQ